RLPQGRPRASLQHVLGPHLRRLLQPRPALRGRLPPLLHDEEEAGADQGRPPGGRRDHPELGGALVGQQLARARGVRHVRRPLRGPPGPPAPLHVPLVRGSCAAQGLPEGQAAAARAPRGDDLVETRKVVLGQRTADEMDENFPTEPMQINMGPSHPAMHGTVRMVLTLDGERVRDADIQLGYTHRCFEKESEAATYTQIFPYTDRLNYVSPMINNVGWAMAIEKLLGIKDDVPERAQYLRVLVSEISRITDHLTCLGASAMELGAFTPFLYMLKAREWLWGLQAEISGARLTHTYCRIGGVVADMPTGWDGRLLATLEKTEKALHDSDTLLTKNRIFRDRMENVGKM